MPAAGPPSYVAAGAPLQSETFTSITLSASYAVTSFKISGQGCAGARRLVPESRTADRLASPLARCEGHHLAKCASPFSCPLLPPHAQLEPGSCNRL